MSRFLTFGREGPLAMIVKTSILLALALLSGCSSGDDLGVPDGSVADAAKVFLPDAQPDAPSDAAAPTCQSLRTAWRDDLARLDKSCDLPGDCTLVGGESLTATCHARPFIGPSCGGAPVRASAYGADLAQRASAWTAMCEDMSCGSLGCVADCAPSRVDCVNHVCVATERSCLPAPPDAGH